MAANRWPTGGFNRLAVVPLREGGDALEAYGSGERECRRGIRFDREGGYPRDMRFGREGAFRRGIQFSREIRLRRWLLRWLLRWLRDAGASASCMKWAKSNGFQTATVFIDRAGSVSSATRPNSGDQTSRRTIWTHLWLIRVRARTIDGQDLNL